MKILDTTLITDAAEMPIKSGTLLFLQNAYQEMLQAICVALLNPGYSAATIYVLYGCANSSGTAGYYNISAGVIFWNGELFYVAATTFTCPVGQTAVLNLLTTQYVGNGLNADPVQFTDTTEHNVHDIRTIQAISAASGSGTVGDFSTVRYVSFLIPAIQVLTAAASQGGVANIAEILGNYPNQQVYVPATSQLGQVLALNNVNIGDVPTGGITIAVTFPQALPAGTNYRISLQLISQGSNPQQDCTVTLAPILSTKTLDGFSFRAAETDGGVQNVSVDWIIFQA